MNYLPIFLAKTVPYETFEDKLALAGEMLLRGVGTVFLVLIVLWGIIAIFGLISGGKAKKNAKPNEILNDELPENSEADETVGEVSDDGELIAAICAAITAYRESEGLSALHYKVVSYQRKSGKKNWTGNNN